MFKASIYFIFFFLFLFQPVWAQNTDSTSIPKIKIEGFVDFYYAYDFNKPTDHNRPSFVYSHSRHNEFALNNAVLSCRFQNTKSRAAISLQSGTYVQRNYANEPLLLRFIYEAYAGYKLGKHIWVDAGIFTSHIGAESAISKNNMTLSRSIMADNTPYYESGVKLTYAKSNKLTVSALVLNGWQNITENNENKAAGTQIQYRPSEKILINSSTFIGKEKSASDSTNSMRYFHNFYTRIDLQKIIFLFAFDIGLQNKNSRQGYIWYNPNLIMKYQLSKRIAVAGRMEYYADQHGVIIYTGTQNGFKTFAPSVNFDFNLTEHILWRVEGRIFHSKDKIFYSERHYKNNDFFLLSSLAFSF